MKTFSCSQPQSLRDFTDANFPQGSFCLARLLRARDVKVNGVRVNSNVTLNAGDVVTYYTTPKDENALTHTAIYEDDNIFIADKLSGVSSEGLCAELNERGTYFAVHRLDRNTAGLLVFAKNEMAKDVLLNAFKAHGVKKTYIAVCKDCFKKDSQTLTAFIKKDEKSALVKVYDKRCVGAQNIITEYTVLERRGGLALVEVRLHTGRTHQIRAHLAHIGCPLLGDNKYGDTALNRRYKLTRQCLVAKYLSFFALTGGLEYLNCFSAESTFNLSLQNYTD